MNDMHARRLVGLGILLALMAGPSCAPLAGPSPSESDDAAPGLRQGSGGEPVIGRLRTRTGVHDLTATSVTAEIDGHPVEVMRAWAGLDPIESLSSRTATQAEDLAR